MIQNTTPVRIFVSRAGMSTRLRLRDNRNNPNPVDFIQDVDQQGQADMPRFDTNVEKGEMIIWELDPLSLSNPPHPGFFPIKSIVSVVQTFEVDGNGNQYKDSVPVLTEDPVNAGNAFVAIVPNPSAGRGKFANYRIEYFLPDDTFHVHDPKILLNS
jgi:hypothetical protein